MPTPPDPNRDPDPDRSDPAAAPDRGQVGTTPPGPGASPEPLDAVRREVVLDAPTERVWAALADDDGLSGWLADEVDLEVREGAYGTVRDGAEEPREVVVEEVVPGRRLGLRWQDVDGRPSVVDVALEPADRGGTRVVVVEVPVEVLSLVAPAADRILSASHAGGGAVGGGGPVASAAGRSLAGVR